MNSENDKICLICMQTVENTLIKKNFHCKCTPFVHFSCYLKFYTENNYKCFICHQYDLEEFYKKMYNDFKNVLKVLDTLKNFNCTCKLDSMYINENFMLKTYAFKQKIVLIYKDVMDKKNDENFIKKLTEYINNKIKENIEKRKRINKIVNEMIKFMEIIVDFEIRVLN